MHAAEDQHKNDVAEAFDACQAVLAQINQHFLGREAAVKLALVTLVADGHLLIEDLPGSGKTSLSAALAAALGLQFSRIQCTNDLLPADVTGLSIFDRETGQFTLKKGPVFTQVLLADELNRAPSKTQSALLQAMEERAVSLDSETYALPAPFLVMATQNPAEHIGTFDLPESQLDRFSVSMDIGRPSAEIQRQILSRAARQTTQTQPVLTADAFLALQKVGADIHVSEAILDYLIALSDQMEQDGQISLSVRYREQLVKLAKAHALISGRHFVTPDDVQQMFAPSLRHRLHRLDKQARVAVVDNALGQVPVP